jgi:plasmid stabilization system protein ParE
MNLVYTDHAVADLQRLKEFIAIHNPSAAARIAAELIGKVSLLTESPHIGSPVKMAPVPDSVRDMVFSKYVVRYSVHTNVIVVLRVWHELEGER